jgi:hypothetical protein
MTRLYDALATTGRAALPALPGRPVLDAGDLPLLRLWQALEARLPDRAAKTVQIAPCSPEGADPAVAVRLARLAGNAMGRDVIVLDAVRAAGETEGPVAFGPLPGRGDMRSLNPELLRAYWDKLAERAPLVILDSPPIPASPWALALAPTVDGVVLLVEAERTRVAVARAARDALTAAGANILGVVLNKRRLHVPGAVYRAL